MCTPTSANSCWPAHNAFITCRLGKCAFTRRLYLSAFPAACITIPAFAAVPVGRKAPRFHAQATQAGHEFHFSLRKALAEGPVVVYFFPAAFTRGCDLEAHTFATHKKQFKDAGATIIGVSAD